MRILPAYLARLFFGWWLLTTAGLTFILLAFDLLGNIVTVTAGHAEAERAVLAYIGLRLPVIVALVMPLASLLATIITILRLLAARELTAIGAAGLPVWRTLRLLLLCSLLPALLHAILVNYILPTTGPQLAAWAKADYRDLPKDAPPVALDRWLASGDLMLHIGGLSDNRKRISDLIVFRRHADGSISDFVRAPQAVYADGQWQLTDTRTIDANGQAHNVQSLSMALPWTPATLSLVGGALDTLRLGNLFKLKRAQDVGSSWLLSLWIQYRLAEPLMSVVMVLLGTLIAFQPARQDGTWRMTAALIGFGFLYFIAVRVLLSLGETAMLPPVTAVWLPPLLALMGCSWYLLWQE